MNETHDARCERVYTDNGFIFIDCLCSLRRAKAEAWDEGFYHGVDPSDSDRSQHNNPYRTGDA